jgi:hypothetical protein
VLADSTAGLLAGTAAVSCFENGRDFEATGNGSVGCGLLPLVTSLPEVRIDTLRTGFAAGSPTNVRLIPTYSFLQPANLRRPGYPDDISIVFADTVVDTSIAQNLQTPAKPARFRVFAHADTGDVQLDFVFRDTNNDGTPNASTDRIGILCPIPNATVGAQITWNLLYDPRTPAPVQSPRQGDVYHLNLERPLGEGDMFTFAAHSPRVDGEAAKEGFKTTPYVVPNPYIEAASFEPARFNVTGRGERRIEFRGLPSTCTIRIFTVRGDLVQTLQHQGSLDGYEPWDLRTRDNLECAPGLYIFHVEAPGIGTHIGKFAIVK